MRRFEFKDVTTSKFWQISQEGPQLTVSWGQIGAKGQTRTRIFDSPDTAFKNQCDLIGEKLVNGYIEVTADGLPIAPQAPQTPTGPSSQSQEAPQSQEGRRAILQNAWGHTIILTQLGLHVITGEGPDRLVQTLGSSKEAEEHFNRIKMVRQKEGYEAQRLEPMSSETVAPPTRLELAGFEGKIDFNDGRLLISFDGDFDSEIPGIVCDALVDHIEQLAPRYVQLLCGTQSPKAGWEQALDNKSLESVEAFVFDTPYSTTQRQGRNSMGSLDAVTRACPNLKNLFATGALALNPVGHLKLETLHLLGEPLSLSLLEALGECYFPSLKSLTLWLGDAGPDVESTTVSSIFSIEASSLREIHVGGIFNVDASSFLAKVATHKMPHQLKNLRIYGECSLEDVKSILENHSESFESLETLELLVWDEEDTGENEWAIQVGSRLLSLKNIDEDEQHEQFLPGVYSAW
jgi:predicted DNA-binding WGR domain protein